MRRDGAPEDMTPMLRVRTADTLEGTLSSWRLTASTTEMIGTSGAGVECDEPKDAVVVIEERVFDCTRKGV